MVPLSVPLLHALEIPLLPFLDISTFTLLTALAFGKVGCLLNGCCCGRPTAGWLSVNSPNRLGLWRPRIPSQLLESAAAWTLLLCAAVLWSQRPFPGAVFMAGAAAYGFIRVILQGTQETQDVLMGINVQKALAGVLGVLATGGLMIGLTASD
jgi:phosphatidylglycerol:prolipoprotein diacylglycerol transferase